VYPETLADTNLADMGDYDPVDENASQTKKGWLTSILELGAWLGALLSGFLAEAISRKYASLVATSVFMVGVVIQATSVHVGYQAILAGRFITYVDVLLFRSVPEAACGTNAILGVSGLEACRWWFPSTIPSVLRPKCEVLWSHFSSLPLLLAS